MQTYYLYGQRRNSKVICVFVGGEVIPSHSDCCTVLAMDPEIEPPVLVIPFGGLEDRGADRDDFFAREMIMLATPNYVDDRFCYRCTRIRDKLLIKVLVERESVRQTSPARCGDNAADRVSLN
jgi:hypothetical protein